jgi:hypothetical protein
MDFEKVKELRNYLKENAYDLNLIEFLSLIGTAVDEYCGKNGADTNDIWDMLYEGHKAVFEELGEADYMK